MIRVLVIAASVALVVTGAVAGIRFGGGKWPPVAPAGGVLSLRINQPQHTIPYNNYPAKWTGGDTYFTTWGDDGKTYISFNDGENFRTGPGDFDFQNLGVNTITSWDANTVGTNIIGSNLLAGWGRHTMNADGFTHKSTGLLCVKPPGAPTGWLYLNTRRFQDPGWGYMKDSQIIKSHDHGVTWLPMPPYQGGPYASPMFPGDRSLGGYVQYGQCYTGTGPDGSDIYIYANLHDLRTSAGNINAPSPWPGGDMLWLGRVRIDKIDDLNAADWSFWKGGDGMKDENWGAREDAAPIMTDTDFGPAGRAPVAGGQLVGFCCGQGIQYLPRYHQYMYYASIYSVFVADHPWGPYRLVPQVVFGGPEVPFTSIIQASMVNGGQSFSLSFNGDVNTAPIYHPSDPRMTYSLFFRPVTLSP